MTTPHYADDAVTLWHGDCLDVLRDLPDASIDAVVTDPPYGLGFMGKAWDADFIDSTISRRRAYTGDPSPRAGENGGYRSAAAEAGRYDLSLTGNRAFGAWCEQWATECLRVLKPGGHLLAFGGTRTWHRLACAIEDAGFEVRDSIAWLYGSGFPKSLDVSKAIDKAAGAEREVVSETWRGDRAGTSAGIMGEAVPRIDRVTAPATPEAATWQGWGTALKPAFEPVVVARKPLAGTVAANVLAHGTGALNIDGCRIAAADPSGGGESGGLAMSTAKGLTGGNFADGTWRSYWHSLNGYACAFSTLTNRTTVGANLAYTVVGTITTSTSGDQIKVAGAQIIIRVMMSARPILSATNVYIGVRVQDTTGAPSTVFIRSGTGGGDNAGYKLIDNSQTWQPICFTFVATVPATGTRSYTLAINRDNAVDNSEVRVRDVVMDFVGTVA